MTSTPDKLLPSAWRVKDFADGWIYFDDEFLAKNEAHATGAFIEPLYTRTPQKDVAGLVEALEKVQVISAHMQSKRSFDLNKIATEALKQYHGGGG